MPVTAKPIGPMVLATAPVAEFSTYRLAGLPFAPSAPRRRPDPHEMTGGSSPPPPHPATKTESANAISHIRVWKWFLKLFICPPHDLEHDDNGVPLNWNTQPNGNQSSSRRKARTWDSKNFPFGRNVPCADARNTESVRT